MKNHQAVPMEKTLDFFTNHALDRWLFEKPPDRDIWGIGLLIVAIFGIIFNLTTVCVYHHKDMRSFSSMLLKGNLVIDCAFLILVVLLKTPNAWIYTTFDDREYFWNSLSVLQVMFIRVYPCLQIASLSSQWFSAALIVEQYYAYEDPKKVVPCMKSGRGLKVLCAILDLAILVHVPTFFKFIQEDAFVFESPLNASSPLPLKYTTTVMTLAEIYTFQSFSTWDCYVYFFFFEVFPWALTCVCWGLAVRGYTDAKRRLQGHEKAEKRIIIPLKAGRCVRAVLCIVFIYMVLKFAAHVCYLINIPYMNYTNLFEGTFLTPMDTVTVNCPSISTHIYLGVNVINAVIKPFILYISAMDSRDIVRMCCKKQNEVNRRVGAAISTAIKPRSRIGSNGGYDIEAASRASRGTVSSNDMNFGTSTTELTAAPY